MRDSDLQQQMASTEKEGEQGEISPLSSLKQIYIKLHHLGSISTRCALSSEQPPGSSRKAACPDLTVYMH